MKELVGEQTESPPQEKEKMIMNIIKSACRVPSKIDKEEYPAWLVRLCVLFSMNNLAQTRDFSIRDMEDKLEQLNGENNC